jgi:two-component system, chemotaxis family, chemotaxis protein CheY
MAKILIVDDSMVARKMMRKVISMTEHTVISEAANGEEAILQVKKNKPDIITLDYDMPRLNGFETAVRILKFYSDIKIIFVSAHSINEFDTQGQKINDKQVIVKPISKDKLIEAINELYIADTNNDTNVAQSNADKNKDINELEANIFQGIEIQKVHFVIITHYSDSEKSMITTILSVDNNSLLLKTTKDFGNSNFTEGDPIVISFETAEKIYICEAEISFIDLPKSVFCTNVLVLDAIDNLRKSERILTSLYVELKHTNYKGIVKAIVKDISIEGVRIITNTEFEKGDQIEVGMFFEKELIRLYGNIMWKSKDNQNKFTYGIKIKYQYGDNKKKKLVEKYVAKLKDEQEKNLIKLGEMK